MDKIKSLNNIGFRLLENISKMDIYIEKELKEKTAQLVFFILLLFIPSFTAKVIGILLLCSSTLVNDIKNKNVELLYFLPYSKKELFSYNLLFLILIVMITSAVSQLYYHEVFLYNSIAILKPIIVLLAIYGIGIMFSSTGHDGFVWSIVITIIDAILGNFGSVDIKAYDFNPYSLVSFTRQGNLLLSFLYSALICYLGYFAYVKKGGEN